jgi:hypothetical protein
LRRQRIGRELFVPPFVEVSLVVPVPPPLTGPPPDLPSVSPAGEELVPLVLPGDPVGALMPVVPPVPDRVPRSRPGSGEDRTPPIGVPMFPMPPVSEDDDGNIPPPDPI